MNKTLTIYTHKDFEILNAVNYIISGEAIKKKERNVLDELVKNVLPDNKLLSNAIIDCGVKGQQFGIVLNKLKNWYYSAYMYQHEKPSQEEIEEFVEKEMR